MLDSLLSDLFIFQGMDLYFKRHDGQAVTCEDFFAAMRDANDVDFANFLLWYGSVSLLSSCRVCLIILMHMLMKLSGIHKLGLR